VKCLVAFRMRTDLVSEARGLTLDQLLQRAAIAWHGVELCCPDWSDGSHSLAFTISSLNGRFRGHGMLNAYWETLRFALPDPSDAHGGAWRRWIDTSLTAPEDVVDWEKAPTVAASSYLVQPRSLALLVEQEIQ